MYFPYLRGRQTELLALRDFARMSLDNRCEIVPVIEPVKSDTAALCRAAREMIANDQPFALVLNPYHGKFVNDSEVLAKLDEDIREASGKRWTPAYVYLEGERVVRPETLPEKSMLIFPETLELTDAVRTLAAHEHVGYLLDGTESSQGFGRFMRRLGREGKRVSPLSNHFHEQRRNVDYLVCEDEFFSDDFLGYREDGYCGVGDYVTLPKGYTEGGSLPYAVAIHLTYQSGGILRIHHFVSDSNLDQSNIQGKFAEAAAKVKEFFSGRPKTAGIRALLEFKEAGRYPGLAALKKWSILNHLELMSRVLGEGKS